MFDWQSFRDYVAPTLALVGGIVGLLGGGLGIYYASTANAVLLRRARRDEAECELEQAKDELWRRAYERAQEMQSASTLVEVGVELQTTAERRAAWALAKEGRASVRRNACFIAINKMPAIFRHAMEFRNNHD